MKQSNPLYCLTVGYIIGASLNKTYNYELRNNGYAFRVQFTPITFVKLSDLNQPINHAGQTYFFGHSPQELYKIAALTKKDLDDGLAAEQNWVNLTKKKLQSNWAKLADLVAAEAKEVEKNGGAPVMPKQTPAAVPATPPAMSGDTEQLAPKPQTEKPQQSPVPAAPVTGTVDRPVREYSIYVAAERARQKGSKSVGYYGLVKNTTTGEVKEIGQGGYTDDFNKILIRALKEAFQAGEIPHSSRDEQTRVTVYTANEYVANMFARNYIRSFARNNWNKKDGSPIAYKELWSEIWNHAAHMLVTAVLCEPDGEDLKICTQRAKTFAEEDCKKRYGQKTYDLIGPPQKN